MTRHFPVPFKAVLCAAIVALCATLCFAAPDSAQAATRGTDVTTASQGNVLVGVNGTFSSPSKATILKRINQIRKEACDQHIANPATGEPLTSADYVPIKWSSDLEWIAQTRAAEGAICWDHIRPNGDICLLVTHNNVGCFAECLAWNRTGLMQGVEQWYEEKSNYVNRNGASGHYAQLIDPGNVAIGVGCFLPANSSYCCIAAEFTFEEGLTEDQIGVTGTYIQNIEVQKSNVREVKMTKKTRMTYGTSTQLNARVAIRFSDYWGNPLNFSTMFVEKPTWTCSNSRLSMTAQSTRSATFKAAKIGPCRVTLKDPATGKSTSQVITVVPKGTKVGTLTPKRGALGVSWIKQTTQTTGYQIAYKYSGSSLKYKKVSASKASTTLSSLKSGKTYLVKIRTYKTINGKTYYSSWSPIKKAVVK